jgi:hypothetical protein
LIFSLAVILWGIFKGAVEQARKAQRGVEIWPYSFFNLGAIQGRVVNATARPLFSGERDLVHIM